MKEQLISLETATLAKEKQFQEYTSYFYTKENGLCSIDTDGEILNIHNDDLTFKDSIWDCNGDFWYNEIEDEEGIYAQTYEPIKYPAPTQSLLQKWLRETHQLHLEIQVQDYVETPKFYWNIFGTYKNNKIIRCIANSPREDYVSYEEALEAGLQKALSYI